ncbi:MAG: hypothetical protein VYB35_11990 [Verrucomicrobiota bacterium]|nr:hypothetical protein [Verrucomicrobiota bacterium]
MVRLLLIVTLLAVGVAGFFSYTNVQTKIGNLESDLDQATTDLTTAQEAQAEAEKDRDDFEKQANDAKAVASRMSDQIGGLQRQVVEQTNRANKHKLDLDQATAELVESRQTSERWRQFEMEYGSRDSIKERLAEIEPVKIERDNFITENSILLSRIEKLSVELSRYTGTSVKVALPPDLAGKVTAVDSQYDFVVLDVGEDQGVREHGELLVGRSDKLIGRLRVLSVEKDRSIANIMPDYKQSEIQTGDSVYSERN